MDTRQIEYILRIAEEKNITRAAEKMFLSQPALNQQLLNLEKELGTPLFHRSRSDWKLTEAGAIYVEAGKKILETKREAYAKISDVAKIKQEEIIIGITPIGSRMLAGIYKTFYQEHPETRLRIIQSTGLKIQKEIASGSMDIGILTLSEGQKTKDVYEELRREEFILVMSKDHPLASKETQMENGERLMDLWECRHEKFAFGDKGSINQPVMIQLFRDAGFLPEIYFQGAGYDLRMAMVEMNLCMSLVEEHHKKDLSDDVVYFKLTNHPALTVSATYRKGKYLSKAARNLLDLIKEYWQEYQF